jgi:Lrp/AsnC family leucine-responsive transcriptional regulator
MRVQKESNRVLDKIDLHILSILQDDGRIVMKDLAERVGLSLTPCIERVKRMERDGVIAGYYARVNPQAMGLQILVFVEITLLQKSEQAFERFRRAMLAFPR